MKTIFRLKSTAKLNKKKLSDKFVKLKVFVNDKVFFTGQILLFEIFLETINLI